MARYIKAQERTVMPAFTGFLLRVWASYAAVEIVQENGATWAVAVFRDGEGDR